MSRKALKRAARQAQKELQQEFYHGANSKVIQFSSYRKRKRDVIINARNDRQQDYLDRLFDDRTPIVLSVGPAGTGKTLLAVQAAIQRLKYRLIERIVITRPAVAVEEQHGFLPGSLEKKMEPWTRPIFDVFEEYWSPQQIKGMFDERTIEIAPLAFMRGRTFKNSWIIADEMQNATPSQMKMVLTRMGEGSKVVITGDLNQHDRGFDENGLYDFIKLLKQNKSSYIDAVTFEKVHVERHPAVKDVLSIYGE